MNHPSTSSSKGLYGVIGLLLLTALPAQAQDDDRGSLAYTGATPTTLEDPALVQKYQATITESDLAAHLYVFASDYFEGRETATRGQKLAATYLAGQYRKLGLEPKGTAEADYPWGPEQYFQPFPLYGRRLAEARLEIETSEESLAASVFGIEGVDGQSYLTFGSAPNVEAGVVFGGYGIEDDELNFNEYKAMIDAGIDYSDKWLVLLRGEPMESKDESLLPTEDGNPSVWTTEGNRKLRHLFRKGLPKGVLIVGDVGPAGSDVAEAARANAPSVDNVGSLSLSADPGGGRQIPPIYTISTAFADQILAPAGKTIAAVKEEIDATLEPKVFEVEGVQVRSTLTHETYETLSENVVAFIEGSDPELKEEVVVLSSHYDHIGIDDGVGEDRINNGADDDGSGTVSILEIAEAFKMAADDGYGPRRSIVFLNVSGEEKGLLGSRYYTDTEPIVPLDQTVTNLNIDMIGRFDPTHPEKSENYVYIIGSNLISQELHDLNLQVNEATGVDLELDERFNSKDDPNQFYRRSDHWNFGKHNIPFIFFFTGTHDDYHGVGDEAHKIEYPRMKRIAQLIFATAWQVANQDDRPAVSGEGFN